MNNEKGHVSSLSFIAGELLAVSAEIEMYDPEELMGPGDDEPSIDVRLRYFDGDWEVYSGDASYDTDHRGYWGAGSVGREMSEEEAKGLAKALVEQVLDEVALDAGVV